MRRFDDPEFSVDSPWSRAGTAVNPLGTRIPYQSTLRALGAYLDEHGACRANLLETDRGFALRYQSHPGRPEMTLVWLEHETLSEMCQDLQRRRRKSLRARLLPGDKRSYENILRALGYELDQVQAYSVLMDEIADGLVVTYQYLNPQEGFNARKRMVILGREAMESVLADAQSRRKQREHGNVSLLAS